MEPTQQARREARSFNPELGQAGACFLDIDCRSVSAGPRGASSAWVENERGVAAIEYALLLALIALTLIVAMAQLGYGVGEHYDDISSAVERPNQTPFEDGNPDPA